ncbi:hypothetical protein QOZ80_6AG0529360 [Eleusine coracana subsp. coracana]|nr:hypothetical protein QOZ80_6AG0529360 [Eleusine coracana subsp. coracana]
MDDQQEAESLCGCCISVLVWIGILVLLVLSCTNGFPVKFTVEEATLERLALVAPGNGTASIAYNLSLVVAVRNSYPFPNSNPNSATRVWRVAPLDAELRLASRPFALVRLAGAETTTDRIRPLNSRLYRATAAAARSVPVALGSGAAAAFTTESAVGTFNLELVVAGEFRYVEGLGEASAVVYRTTVRCPLRLLLSTATTAAAFAAFEHTLPQECEHLEQVSPTK